MELTVLGSGGTWPRPGGARRAATWSATTGSTCGSTPARARSRACSSTSAIADIHAIADHPRAPGSLRRLYPCFYARHYGGLGEPGTAARARPRTSRSTWPRCSSPRTGGTCCARPSTFTARRARRRIRDRPVPDPRVEMTHIGVQALGYRIEADGDGARLHRRHAARATRSSSWRGTPTCSCCRGHLAGRDDAAAVPHVGAPGGRARREGRARTRSSSPTSGPTLDPEVSLRRGRRPSSTARSRSPREGMRWRSARDASRRPRGRTSSARSTWELGYQEWAEGSVLFSMGKTRVLVAASVSEDAPRWLKGTGRGWVTGEYSMLPRATSERSPARGEQGPTRRPHAGDPAADRPLAPRA